jgi:hypothetical protein
MYDGWLEYAGTEILNAARTATYLKAFVPQLDVKLTYPGLRTARGHATYVSPAADAAPWYVASRAVSGDFYGFMPTVLDGVDDSSRTVTAQQLGGNGAVHSKPRYGSREIRVRLTAFAKDDKAMNEGLAWLKDVLSSGDCGQALGACTDNDLRLYAAAPLLGASDANLLRTFVRVEVLDNAKMVKVLPSNYCAMREIEFLFSAGVPWAWTAKTTNGSLTLASGSSFTDPAGEDCWVSTNPYTEFIADPFYTAIVQPPAPPRITPPNVVKVTSWRRSTLAVLQADVSRWGRVAPILTITTGSGGASQVRLRFYGGGTITGCGHEGEFLISYIPPNATMTIDSIRREIKVLKSNGKTVVGGQLVYGSDGMPVTWPSLGCAGTYTMTADMLPGQTGITVLLETAVRE